MDLIIDFFKTSFLNEFQTTMTGDRIASGLLVSFFVTLFVVIVYRFTYQGIAYSRNFCFSLVLLSMVTSMVIMTVTTNLTLSLGMVGALSIVRFRTAVKDPADTVFMFWAIGVGIMAGAGLVYIAIITNLSLGALYLIYFYVTKNLRSAPYLVVVKYQGEYAQEVEDILRTLPYRRVKSKVVSGGTIEVCLETKLNEKTFPYINELSTVQGVLQASAISYQGDTSL